MKIYVCHFLSRPPKGQVFTKSESFFKKNSLEELQIYLKQMKIHRLLVHTHVCVCVCVYTHIYGASLVAQSVKNLPAMRETWVWSLGWKNPLEEDMATHSNILAWRIPMDRGAWQAAVHGVARSWTWLTEQLSTAPYPCLYWHLESTVTQPLSSFVGHIA